MLWVSVWVLLVAGTAVGAFVFGRDLWRRGAALVHEVGQAADRLGALGERLDATPVGPTVTFAPGFARDRADLDRVRDERRRRRLGRRARRDARNEAAYARWRAFWAGGEHRGGGR